jgi:cell division transport system ATP-binding protein
MSSQGSDFVAKGATLSGEPVVNFQGVGMRYGRAPEVLRDINLNLSQGSFHFLTGASGAGKSSLLKLIYLAHEPSRGLIRLFGRDAATLPRDQLPGVRRRIGVVFQAYRLLNHLTVFDNAALPLRVAGRSFESYRQDVKELLDWVGLGPKLSAMPATLSGGEQQRLAVARAVVAKPDLLLVDEPTGNVDQEMGRRILRLLAELNRMGATVLVATHDRALVAEAGAPVLVLKGGRIADAAPASPGLADAGA